MRRPNPYASGPLDRAALIRKDPALLDARLTRAETRILPLWQAKSWVTGPREAPRLAFLAAAEAWWRDRPGAEAYFLGLTDEIAYFAVDLSDVADPAAHPELADRGEFVDLRAVGPLVPPPEGAIMAYARGLVWWHARHRFCGVCGSPAPSAEGGHVRRCANPDCATSHFPRTDPAVIMLVHDGDRCLLGRQSRFPSGMHSTLAGFVEPGESLEDAVAREVFEETSVRVTDVRYHSSQPWPFPASIMLGFHARATSTAIRVDTDELETAAWFDRDFIASRPDSDAFRMPRLDSIARRLIEDWAHGLI